jgi:hypothetical protein
MFCIETIRFVLRLLNVWPALLPLESTAAAAPSTPLRVTSHGRGCNNEFEMPIVQWVREGGGDKGR